eukprot:9584502-Prorocentrum_lima.AAC.1
MHSILAAVGAPQSALKIIPQIIDTRKICRQFKLPPPSSEATARLTTAFDPVQHDLLFLYSDVEQTAVGLPAAGVAIPPLQPTKDPWQH